MTGRGMPRYSGPNRGVRPFRVIQNCYRAIVEELGPLGVAFGTKETQGGGCIQGKKTLDFAVSSKDPVTR